MLRVWKLVAGIPEISCKRLPGHCSEVWSALRQVGELSGGSIASLLISTTAFLAAIQVKKMPGKKKLFQPQMMNTTSQISSLHLKCWCRSFRYRCL